MQKSTLLIVVLMVSTSAYSNDVVNTTPLNTVVQNNSVNNVMASNPKDWNLTDVEWAKYLELMHGQAGRYYSHLSPPEVLGEYANDDNELRHYAEIVAVIEHGNVERELKFDKAFREAALRLYPAEPIVKPFDMSAYTPIPKKISEDSYTSKSGDHLVLFTDINLNNDDRLTKSLTNQVKNHAGVVLDVYCLKSDESTIRKWAKKNDVPIDLVASNRITLNSDDGKFLKTLGSTTLPALLLVRNGKSTLLNEDAINGK